MALNKAMQAALKALSYPDIQMKKNYKAVRQVINLAHPPYLRPFYKTWDHKVELSGREIPVRIFSPKQELEHPPVLLFFHGGGWVTGNIDSYNNVCTRLAALTGQLVVSVDYRLAPEHRFPEGLMDCYQVAKEVYLNPEELFGVEPEQITLIGDSAGGNLAAAVSLMAQERREFLPDRQILIYPAVYNDYSENSPFESVQENGTDYLLTSKTMRDYMELYQSGPEDLLNPYFAPYLAKDLSGQPRTMVITAEYDPLRDEGEAYADRLAKAGSEVLLYRIPDVLHGFFSLSPRFPAVGLCYELIRAFSRSEDMPSPQQISSEN